MNVCLFCVYMRETPEELSAQLQSTESEQSVKGSGTWRGVGG